jgi:acid stress-induced BolA-like protein IbaG/YrbA
MDLKDKVEKVITSEFPRAVVSLQLMDGGRFAGRVVWDGFKGKNDITRQQMLRKVLRKKLGVEAVQVGILLTYTPREVEVMSAA